MIWQNHMVAYGIILLCDLFDFCVCDEKLLHRHERFILFPPSSNLQLSMALVSPVWLEHKIYVNLGFNINYDLPSSLSQFTRPAFWPQGRALKNELVGSNSNSTDDHKYNVHSRIRRDMSAGEVYAYLKDILMLYGHHEVCLLQMVCEVAKIPFHFHESEQLLEDIIHLILTPSLHQSFDANEEKEREQFEEAERIGAEGKDCILYYPKCDSFPLEKFTHLMEVD